MLSLGSGHAVLKNFERETGTLERKLIKQHKNFRQNPRFTFRVVFPGSIAKC